MPMLITSPGETFTPVKVNQQGESLQATYPHPKFMLIGANVEAFEYGAPGARPPLCDCTNQAFLYLSRSLST